MPSAALERHPASSCAALRAIEAAVTRQRDGTLQLAYRIEGDLARLRVPAPRTARVADKLWQHTCCELFVGELAGPGYQEFNFSPSGEWAAYRFTRYREGVPLVAPDPKIRVQRSAGRLELRAQVVLQLPAKPLIGLSAVIEEQDGTLSYWALRHAPGKPDFHHSDAFALAL
jgi:hypothetical protein